MVAREMSEVYVIKPQKNSLSAIGELEKDSFSFPTKIFNEGLISEILVNTKEASWAITLHLKEELAAAQVEELEEGLCRAVEGLQRVKLQLIYPQKLPSLEVRLPEKWAEFISLAGQRFAGVSGWLTEARYQLCGEKLLELQVRNQAGVEYLTRRAAELGALSQEVFYTELKFNFVVGDFEAKIFAETARWEQENEVQLKTLAKGAALPRTTEKTSNSKPSTGGTDVILGKKFSGEPTSMKQLYEEQEQIIVRGVVCRLESKLSKQNKKFYLGDLTDYLDSVSFKIFPRNAPEDFEERFQEGTWVYLRGNLQFDPYARELVILVSDIMPAIPSMVRVDDAPEKRIELHLHTKMSAMDATADPIAALKLAAQFGHPALAITDHGVVHSFPEVYHASKKLGVKVIYGVEGYLVDDGVPIVLGAQEELLDEVEYVVFDLETTGFNPQKEDILEIGAVKLKRGEVCGEFKSLLRPKREISAEIQQLTGITPEMVADAPEPEGVLREFREFCGQAVLVAHNARFDVGFIKVKYQQFLELDEPIISLDTLGLARSVWSNFKSYRLNSVAKELGINLVNHHRAVDDACCAAEIFKKAMTKLAARNFMKLNDLNELVKEGGVEHLRTYHIILLVKSQVGMKNLYKLVSNAHIKYFHRHPRIPRSELAQLRDGLIIGSACEAGELYQGILDGADEGKLREIASFYDYLEIQPLANNQFLINKGRIKSREELQDNNRLICDLGKQLDKPVVATCDVHFLNPHEAVLREILLLGQGFEDASQQTPLYYRTTSEMLAEFAYLGTELAQEVVVKNPQFILKQVGEVAPVPEKFYPPVILGAEEEIRNMAYNKAKDFYGDPLPKLVEERLEWELKSIIEHGYAVLYLTAQKLVKKSLDDGYLVGSRGSVGSSFVATMCNITEVNPLPGHYRCGTCRYSEFKETGEIGSGYDLPDKNCPHCNVKMIKDGQDIPFATFMGFEGDKEPDIDLNFSGDYQSKVHRYTEELFGKGYVFRAGTVTGLAEKMAFGFVKGYMDDKGVKLRQAEINRLVKGCTGVRRSTGQHPGGLYVVPQDQEIYTFTPIQFPANDKKAEWITTHFDYHGALEGRLVKLDILGHDDPTVIRMLHDLTGIDPRTVPMDDPQTMRIFSSIETLGLTSEALGFDLGSLAIPEFGTGFVRQMLEETKPTTFSELIFISGLSHGTNVWLGNAQEFIKNGTATLSEVISTRDDIMNYLIFKGLPPKTSFKIMEKVRKGKGLAEEDIEIMKEHEIPDWYIESCQRIKYMFPKAHASAYVMMAFRIAYFKVHHPEAFYATYFSVRADEFDADIVVQGEQAVRQSRELIKQKGNDATQKEKNLDTILEVVLESMLRGIKFLRVDIYKSDPKRFLITPEGLLPPLASLQGLGENAAQSLANARQEGEFFSIEEMKSMARLTSSVIEVLQKHGCLQGMSETAQLTLF